MPVVGPRAAQLQGWTQQSLPASRTRYSVGYGNGVFVALGYGSTYGDRSTDGGLTWSQVTLPASRNWIVLATDGAGTWIAGADATTSGAISTDDGATWSALTLPASGTLRCLGYGNGYFVAAWQGGTVAYRSNDNGTSWTSASVGTAKNWAAMATDGAGKWVMLSGNVETSGTRSSNDGSSWSNTGTFTSAAHYALGYVRGYFIALNNVSGNGLYSTDGASWTSFTFTGIGTPAAPAAGQGVLVACPGVSNSSALVSYTGTSAFTVSLPATFAGGGVAYGSGRFVMTLASSVNYVYTADVNPRGFLSATTQSITRSASF